MSQKYKTLSESVQFRLICFCLFPIFALASAAPTAAAVAITTYHYDNLRTGWNQKETHLTSANLSSFRLLKAVPLDEQVDAQPLFVPDVTIGRGRFLGTKHNVVYIATENNTVYAIEAATSVKLLKRSLGPAVPQSALPGHCNANSAVVGINSTPVIDLASKTLYVMAYTYSNAGPVYLLHALDLGTLRDQVSPAIVQATATLSDGSHWSFDAASSHQRAALLEASGNIYAGFASFCDLDTDRSRGWLLGWRAGSLIPLAANYLNNQLVPTPDNNYFLSSIWMSGYGIASDAAGNLFFATGNSNPDGMTWNRRYNLSESIIKMSPDLTKLLSFFTPSGSLGLVHLENVDADFGSGGVLVLPEQPGNLRLATAAGKAGEMYLLDRNRLGGHRQLNAGVLGTYTIGGCWCGESYFTGWDGIGRVVSSAWVNIVVWKVQTSPSAGLVWESKSPDQPGSMQDPGFFTSISSNGDGNAIIWAVGRPVDKSPANVMLYAFDPKAAAQGNGGWLFAGPAGTWPNVTGNANIVPVVANGRVYVASYKELAIFGLASAGAASPEPAPPHAEAALPAPPHLPPNLHEISGTIKAVAGDEITLATRTGKLVQVDAASAVRRHLSVVLLAGEPVTVFGSDDGRRALHATSILHAKPRPEGWPTDR
jgi:hypothetical protein